MRGVDRWKRYEIDSLQYCGLKYLPRFRQNEALGFFENAKISVEQA